MSTRGGNSQVTRRLARFWPVGAVVVPVVLGAALAHRVAREIPEVLDQLDCYCGCEMHAGHQSLLSCYTDGHAAT